MSESDAMLPAETVKTDAETSRRHISCSFDNTSNADEHLGNLGRPWSNAFAVFGVFPMANISHGAHLGQATLFVRRIDQRQRLALDKASRDTQSPLIMQQAFEA